MCSIAQPRAEVNGVGIDASPSHLRVNLIGPEGEGLKEIAEVTRIEDRNHFEALVPRIYEPGGQLPGSMVEFHDVSACPPAALPANAKDIRAMLTVLVEAERCAVRGYTHICKLTAGKDHRTYDCVGFLEQ